MSRLSLLVCLLTLFAAPFAAPSIALAAVDPYDAAACERAFDEGRFARAVEICQPLAEDGLADAQAVMGQLHQDGRGVPRDYTEAARWYTAAAEQGHVEAQFNLGTMYRYGVGVTRDLARHFHVAERVVWTTRSATWKCLAAADTSPSVGFSVSIYEMRSSNAPAR